MGAFLRGTGKVLISAGIAIILFLAYQLLGTNVLEQRAQDDLRDQVISTPSEPESDNAPKPSEGDGVALLRIPKIDVDKVVVEGVSVDALKKGPGHYPETALPGEDGNVVISGHRTTYGAPFYRLDEVVPGDVILLQKGGREFRYRVVEQKIVAPNDRTVVVRSDEAKLTLTTCHPRFSAAKRLIVIAELEPGEPT